MELTSSSGWWESEKSSPYSFYLALLTLGLMAGLRDLLAKRSRARVMTGRFVSPRTLGTFGLAGLAGIGLGIYFGNAGIESCLWAEHFLPRARGELAAQLVAESKEKELMELSQKEVLLLVNETQKFSKKVLQRSLNDGEAKLESALINELTNKVSLLQFQEQQAALKSKALGPSVNTMIEIHKLQSAAVGGRLEVLFAAVAVWIAAALALKAFREQRFTFYPSAEEEQTAISQALQEQQLAAEKERLRRSSLRFTVILICVLPLIFPYLYWQADEQASLKVIFLLGEVGALTLALIVVLQIWRSAAQRHKLYRVLLVLSAIIAAAALLHGPISLMEQGIGIGAATGTILGLVLRWAGTKKVV